MKILPNLGNIPRKGWRWKFEDRVYKIIGEKDEEYWIVDYIVKNDGDNGIYPKHTSKQGLLLALQGGSIEKT